jgi:uncharacterized protein YegL
MTNSQYTHLALIVDRSGSMTSIEGDMEPAIHGLIAEQAKLPGELHIDVTTFDTTIETLYVDVRPDEVKGRIIVPRGGTALNDALGSTIVRLGEKFANMPEEDRPGTVILAVITDGQENASREYTTEQVKALVEKQKAEFNWAFTFLGTGIDSFAVAGGYGISRGETLNFAANMSSDAIVAASVYMGATRAGVATEYSEADRDAAMGSSSN